MGLDADFNPRRMERFLALVQGSGVAPVIVLSKADTVADARALFARMQTLRERLPAGVEIVALDARDAEAAACLAQHTLPGRTLALLGSSGAGKSTLTNTLLGAARQDTGAVRESDGRGQHTTTARSLFRLPGGACVIDTPGLRTASPMPTRRDRGSATFGDVAALAPACRFPQLHAPRGARLRGAREGVIRRPPAQLPQAAARRAKRDTMSALERQRRWRCGRRAGAHHVGGAPRPSAESE